MMYVLRLWVSGKLEETLETANREVADARYRAIVAEWPKDWADLQWSITVIAEPTPFPAAVVTERSYTVASYQHPARRAAA